MTPNPVRDLYAFQLTNPGREAPRRQTAPTGAAHGRDSRAFLALVIALATAMAGAGLYWLI